MRPSEHVFCGSCTDVVVTDQAYLLEFALGLFLFLLSWFDDWFARRCLWQTLGGLSLLFILGIRGLFHAQLKVHVGLFVSAHGVVDGVKRSEALPETDEGATPGLA